MSGRPSGRWERRRSLCCSIFPSVCVFFFEAELINNCHFSSPLHSTCFKLLCEKIGSRGGGGMAVCAFMFVWAWFQCSYAEKTRSLLSTYSHTQAHASVPPPHPVSTFTLHFICTPFQLSLTPLFPLFLFSPLQTLSALSELLNYLA